MKLDFVIKNGHVVDPAQNIDQVMDIAIKDNHIVAFPDEWECDKVVDASGCYVFPGLIFMPMYMEMVPIAQYMQTIFLQPVLPPQ